MEQRDDLFIYNPTDWKRLLLSTRFMTAIEFEPFVPLSCASRLFEACDGRNPGGAVIDNVIPKHWLGAPSEGWLYKRLSRTAG